MWFGLPGLLTLPWKPESDLLSFSTCFLISASVLFEILVLVFPSLVWWTDFWFLYLEDLSWKSSPWTGPWPSVNQALVEIKAPFPGHFWLHNSKHFCSHHEPHSYYLSLKVISLMHEGQLSPMWLIIVTKNLTRSMSSPLLIKGIALLLLFITWDKARPISKQNVSS